MNRLTKLALALTLALSLPTSYAGGSPIVFDPTNYSQNIITAAKTASSYIKQLEQYATQLQQFKLLGKNSLLTLIDPLLVDFAGEAARVGNVMSAARELERSIGSLSSTTENLKSLYGASGKSPGDFLASVAQRRNAGDKILDKTMLAYHNNLNAVGESLTALNVVSKTISKSEGTNQLLQGLNKSMMVMIQQNNAVLEAAQVAIVKEGRLQAEQQRSDMGLEIMEQRRAQQKSEVKRILGI